MPSLWTTAKHHEFPKYLNDALIDFYSNVTNIKAAVEGASSLERFWEKHLPVPRNTSKICNDVISACYENSNVNETLIITNFYLNTAVLLIFFKIFVNGDVVNAQTRGVLSLKNPIKPSVWTVYRSIMTQSFISHVFFSFDFQGVLEHVSPNLYWSAISLSDGRSSSNHPSSVS